MTVADWSTVAHLWDKHFEWNARCFQPIADWFSESLTLADGARVLDVAGGAGFPAIGMARRAPGCSFTCTDLSADMMRLAERRARADGVPNIAFEPMNAHALAFPSQSFDAVTCASGLMLFDDPVKVVTEMRRVTKQGGRIAIAVWDTPTRNPFLAIFGRAVVAAGFLERPDRTAPGPFRLAEAGELERVMRAGGLEDVTIESRSSTVIYESIESYVAMGRTLAPNVAAALAHLSPRDVERLEELVRAEITPSDGGELRLTATALCAVARRGQERPIA